MGISSFNQFWQLHGSDGSGSGGDGTAIFSYVGTSPLWLGGTITYVGGNVVHTFTANGTLTPLIPLLADSSTGATTNLPVGTTAQRTAVFGTGSTRFNTDLGTLEWYNEADTTWYPLNSAQYLVETDPTGAAVIPSGTTAQRPASPVMGYLRFNTDLDTLEWYNSITSSWVSI